MTRIQAINAVRNAANYVIEQRTRQARGWDRGMYRDDDLMRYCTIKQAIRTEVAYAFDLCKQHARA